MTAGHPGCERIHIDAGASFVCLLLRADVQSTLDLSTETLLWSSALAQGEEGNGRCYV